jgi:hypothetical protein
MPLHTILSVFSLALHFKSAIVLIFQFTSHQLFAQLHSISSKLSPLAFVGIYSTPLFCRHCSSIDLYIPCSDLDLSTGFLIFSWLADVDSIYLLVYAAQGASHQSHSSIYINIYTSLSFIAHELATSPLSAEHERTGPRTVSDFT